MTTMWCLLLSMAPLAYAIPISNGILNSPEIECSSTSLAMSFDTEAPYEGHVYVKGQSDKPECVQDGDGKNLSATITLEFDTCNVQRRRSLNPRGIFVTTTVVVSFHPQFVTKIDRAYRIQCFYMEADKTVSAEIQVSELSTAFQTQVVEMPMCSYHIVDGSANGTDVNYAIVGQQVYHKWVCETSHPDVFCMIVHSCTVDDGNGDTIQIIDEKGCAYDKYVLNNLEYPEDLTAGQEAHVIKYADKEGLYYNCQIMITIKEPHGECARPVCEEPTGFNAISIRNGTLPSTTETDNGTPDVFPEEATAAPARVFRRANSARRRIVKREAGPGEAMLDVHAELNALQIPDDVDIEKLLRGAKGGQKFPEPNHAVISDHLIAALTSDSMCVSPASYSIILAFALVCSLVVIVFIAISNKFRPAKI